VERLETRRKEKADKYYKVKAKKVDARKKASNHKDI